MLRNLLVLSGALLGAGGIGLLAAGEPSGFALIIFGGLVLMGTLYERIYYKRTEGKAPGARFQRTAERFVDDETGKTVTVWIDPATGERAYIAD